MTGEITTRLELSVDFDDHVATKIERKYFRKGEYIGSDEWLILFDLECLTKYDDYLEVDCVKDYVDRYVSSAIFSISKQGGGFVATGEIGVGGFLEDPGVMVERTFEFKDLPVEVKGLDTIDHPWKEGGEDET